MSDNKSWFEVWADLGLSPPYLLLLMGGERPNACEIFDPREQKVVHAASSYQEAMFWLSEDEYERVGDRVPLAGTEAC